MTDAPAGTPAIEVHRLDHIFAEGAVRALSNVSLTVKKGSFVSLIGPSGCGKSTLLNILAGLLVPTAGEVKMLGKPVEGPSEGVGIMFQQHALLPWRTTIENVLLPIEIAAGRKRAAAARPQAQELIDLVGLRGFEDAYPSELSGGMAQRAAICRMLITQPDILLLDEPFGALDELTRDRMDLELQRIAGERGATTVMVTHSIPESVFLSDIVVVMSARPGRIAQIIEIDMPRPRSHDTFSDPRFGKYVAMVRTALDEGYGNEHN